MDVVSRSALLYLSIALAALGCSKVKTAETVYPKVSDSCQEQVVPGRHVVRWVNGEVTLIAGMDRDQVIRDFVTPNLERLDFVEPDFSVRLPNRAVSIAPLNDVPAVDNWGVARAGADVAWRMGYRGGGITVAVIDSGMDLTHPQLSGRVARNPGEIGTDAQGNDKSANKVDDDGNGLVDDSVGYDFSADRPHVFDTGEHGTHVAGTIAAEHSDETAGPHNYAQGIAPEARILPLTFIGSSGSGTLYDAMRAIDYAVERGARVLNASWGGAGCSTLLRDQISGLYEKKVIFVAAAGNSGLNIDFSAEYPAAFNLLAQFTIGATGRFNARAIFSNYGDRAVHLFAPGVEIVSTIPGGGYGVMSGTSMATPLVSGAVAILLGAKPSATIEEIRSALYLAADRDPTYRNASRGRINIAEALRRLLQ